MEKFLLEHGKKKAVSFHMPGHKGKGLYEETGHSEFLDEFLNCDITEIKGADNLFQAEGIIEKTQKIYASLYNVDKSYLLINGTSGGLIAAILATVAKGGKLIMGRNCHKSVFNALTLGDITPAYVEPEIIEEYGISGAFSPKKIEAIIQENKDASAIIIPSPNYYGICSDIEKIAQIVHRAGKVLIVDQAHGAHLNFMEGNIKSAEGQGADIVVNSIHKTLASITQSAVLNVNLGRVNQYVLEDKLQMIQSTSPSYILMASLDINAAILKETEAVNRWQRAVDFFYKEAKNIEGLKLLKHPLMDYTKINLDMSCYGITGRELEAKLIEKNIYSELYTGDILMCMTGIGNREEDFVSLLEALKEIANSHNLLEKKKKRQTHLMPKAQIYSIPQEKGYISIDNAAGHISAAIVVPYPPGIPYICPGEKISEEACKYIRELRTAGEKVIGVNEKGEILVGKE